MVSAEVTVVAWIRTSTSRGLGDGVATSTRRRTSGEPKRVWITALIIRRIATGQATDIGAIPENIPEAPWGSHRAAARSALDPPDPAHSSDVACCHASRSASRAQRPRPPRSPLPAGHRAGAGGSGCMTSRASRPRRNASARCERGGTLAVSPGGRVNWPGGRGVGGGARLPGRPAHRHPAGAARGHGPAPAPARRGRRTGRGHRSVPPGQNATAASVRRAAEAFVARGRGRRQNGPRLPHGYHHRGPAAGRDGPPRRGSGPGTDRLQKQRNPRLPAPVGHHRPQGHRADR